MTLRNIEGLESCKSIMDMVSSMIVKVNQECEKGPCLPIVLDQKSVDKIIQAEEAAEAEKTKEEEQDEKNENGDDRESEEAKPKDGDQTEEEQKPQQTMAQIVKGPERPVEGPYIAARALYAVPAKKSRRRGEKSGCAYLVLTAPPPKIPERAQAPIEDKMEGMKIEDEKQETAEAEAKKPAASTEQALTNGESNFEPKEEQVASEKQQPAKQHNDFPALSAAEKSRLTAVGKLQLIHVVEAFQRLAKEDAKSQQVFHKVLIDVSPSQKTWKDKETHRDRREGTIFGTGDYKQFFSNQSKQEEVRNSRPKPLPGGGVSSIGDDGDETGKLSAIVLHLRAKREEQMNRKKAKSKKGKDGKKSSKGGGGGGDKKQDGGGKNNNSNSNSKSSKSRRGGSGKGQRGGGGKKKNTPAPMILAKPSGK